jgi:hypothetical protein
VDSRDEDVIDFELTEGERTMLWRGLLEWGGPARCTNELAVAMGYADVPDMFEQQRRLADAVRSSQALSRFDWLRVVLATEIVFASDVVGSGCDWSTTTGLADTESLATLRSIQRKTTGEFRPLIGRGFGTRPMRPDR